MNRLIEEKFIKTFVEKRIRARLIFELASKEKRWYAIHRFANPEKVLIHKYIKKKSDKLDSDDVKKYFDIKQKVYVIQDDVFDGMLLDFEDAIESSWSPGITILICDETTVFIKTESTIGYGAPTKYILHKK